MRDFISPGAFAGAIGGIALAIFVDIPLTFLLGQEQTFVYYAKRLIMFEFYKGPLAYLVGLGCHLTLGAFYGVVLSYLIKVSTPKNYLLKGMGVGMGAWVLHIATTTFYRMPGFVNIPPIPAFTLMVGSSIYGLITATTLKILTHNFEGGGAHNPADGAEKRVIYTPTGKVSVWDKVKNRI